MVAARRSSISYYRNPEIMAPSRTNVRGWLLGDGGGRWGVGGRIVAVLVLCVLLSRRDLGECNI